MDGDISAKVLRFSYDADGSVVAVDYSADGGSTFNTYYYVRNAQNDVVKLIDNSGAAVVEYLYDSWGKVLSVTGSLATTLGYDQPFFYRGYVYDREIGLYYLQSRYYDPTTCRFISADVYLSTGQGVLGHNSFAYCLNDPGNMADDNGNAARDLALVSAEGASGCNPVQYYQTMDEAAIAFANSANRVTAQKHVEVCAFIYASSFYDFETKEYVTRYSLSEMYIGQIDNVIENYIWYSAGAVGFVHTHPNNVGYYRGENAKFSCGDAFTSIFSSVCYMSDTASGKLYKITRQRNWFNLFTKGVFAEDTVLVADNLPIDLHAYDWFAGGVN